MKVYNLLKKTAALGTGLSVLTQGLALAQGTNIREGIDAANTGETPTDINTVIERIIRVLLFVVGAASVIMLIIGGIRYVISSGDQTAVGNAKNTILYAVIGVIVALLAWAAVDFVFRTISD